MATKKTEDTQETASKFYVVKTAFQVRDKIDEKVKELNEKHVKTRMEKGREFITELKSDPIKRIDDFIDDSREALTKVKETRTASIRERVETTRNDMRDAVEKLNKEARKVYEGIEHDAKLIVDDMKEMGKEKFDKIPMKKTIEKKINAGINAIPSKLNLPSKAEIDNLVTGIDGVNKKVDALNKEFAGA